MLVARGRTKEVSWREVSTVKKESENKPPPSPVNYWPGAGKEGSALDPSLSHLGSTFVTEARQPTGGLPCPSTQGTGPE